MPRTNMEVAEEILRRVELVNKKEAVRKRKRYAAIAAAGCLALIVGLSFVIPTAVPDGVVPGAPGATSAAMLAGGAVGGYVLIGVIGFVLGMAVALFSLRGGKN